MNFFPETLADNEVYVYGSNTQGFHGAGTAGWAFARCKDGGDWRFDPAFQKAIHSPAGSEHRVGRWAVFGVGHGPQTGREGKSYAITTVTRPGARRSIPRDELVVQMTHFLQHAVDHPGLRFLITPIGTGNAGWTHDEILDCWTSAFVAVPGDHSNVVFYLAAHDPRKISFTLARSPEQSCLTVRSPGCVPTAENGPSTPP